MRSLFIKIKKNKKNKKKKPHSSLADHSHVAGEALPPFPFF
jgi:hypothetical protein